VDVSVDTAVVGITTVLVLVLVSESVSEDATDVVTVVTPEAMTTVLVSAAMGVTEGQGGRTKLVEMASSRETAEDCCARAMPARTARTVAVV
jgi:hypothetical protein